MKITTYVKEELKKFFPEIKFSVRKKKNCLTIIWENGISVNAEIKTIENIIEPLIVNSQLNVNCKRVITDLEYRKLAIKTIEDYFDCKYNELENEFYCTNGNKSFAKKNLLDYLDNSISCDLNSKESCNNRIKYYENIDKSIVPILITKTNFIKVQNNYSWKFDIKDLTTEYITKTNEDYFVRIEEKIKLTTADYDHFVQNLNLQYDWLEDKGGKIDNIPICIYLYADFKQPLLVNSEGYLSPKFITLANEDTIASLLFRESRKIISLKKYKEYKIWKNNNQNKKEISFTKWIFS